MVSEEILLWLAIISAAAFIISLFSLPWLVAMIPPDYFCHDNRVPTPWKRSSPTVRVTLIVLKNCLGVLLFAGGILMLFIPGQGILTMAMGLVLMDYPGKYRLERKIVSVPTIFRGLNWLRQRRGAPPLELD